MSLLQRVRESGKCPPSLLSEDRVVTEDGFEDAAMQVLDSAGKPPLLSACVVAR